MAAKKQAKKDIKTELISKLRKYGIFLIIILAMIKVNKPLFFIVLFSIFAFIGKQIRGQFGLKMVVLDPLIFCAVLLARFIGLKEAIIFIAFNTLIVDFITNIASIGTFLNFTLYSISVSTGVLVFGALDMAIYGNFASILYSILYYFFRRYVLPDDPIAVTSKSITSFIFTFLYITFFGPLFKLLMS